VRLGVPSPEWKEGRERGREGGKEGGRKEGRKEGGREEGRKGGREEGREGMREEGRKEGRLIHLHHSVSSVALEQNGCGWTHFTAIITKTK
jgi:hypothetical protein